MWDFLFENKESGEEFFVECENLKKAFVILEMSGFERKEVKYRGRVTIEEAEIMGLDTY